jgi:hypothetical protein
MRRNRTIDANLSECVMLDDRELELIAGAAYADTRWMRAALARTAEPPPSIGLPRGEMTESNPDPGDGQNATISMG